MSYEHKYNDIIITFKHEVDYYRALKIYNECQVLGLNNAHFMFKVGDFVKFLQDRLGEYNIVNIQKVGIYNIINIQKEKIIENNNDLIKSRFELLDLD